jgi:hypothetical protein
MRLDLASVGEGLDTDVLFGNEPGRRPQIAQLTSPTSSTAVRASSAEASGITCRQSHRS